MRSSIYGFTSPYNSGGLLLKLLLDVDFILRHRDTQLVILGQIVRHIAGVELFLQLLALGLRPLGMRFKGYLFILNDNYILCAG